MKLISWNVNGIRAIMKKDFPALLEAMAADVVCLQETKAQDHQIEEVLETLTGYTVYSNSAVRKGYSGTAILTRTPPVEVFCDVGIDEHDQEGRVIHAEFPDFYLVNVYTPNSGNGLKRLDYRQEWDKAFVDFLKTLEKKKPVIVCGDLNVAHQEIDIARPKANYNKTAGYTQVEIDGMDNLLKAGFVDTFRHFHSDTVQYSWWSMRTGARARDIGWRIDYFLCSQSLLQKVKKAEILGDIMGSDHCPILLEIA